MKNALRVFVPLLLIAAAGAAQASVEWKAGDRILLEGKKRRSCAGRVRAVPHPGFALVELDQDTCGDASQPYEAGALRRFEEVQRYRELSAGDAVTLEGHFAQLCSARVRAISRHGLVSLDMDSLLCADAAGVKRSAELRKIEYLGELEVAGRQFRVGQMVRVEGLRERCDGRLLAITDSGFARLRFESPSCAYGGKLFPLEKLEIRRQRVSRDTAASLGEQRAGQRIFEQVMREIASAKRKPVREATDSSGRRKGAQRFFR